MENKELKKMSKTAIIVAAVLAVILIGSIDFSALGGKDKNPDSTEGGTETTVTDKTAPEVKMKQRYIFTNDIAALTAFSNMKA